MLKTALMTLLVATSTNSYTIQTPLEQELYIAGLKYQAAWEVSKTKLKSCREDKIELEAKLHDTKPVIVDSGPDLLTMVLGVVGVAALAFGAGLVIGLSQ